MIHNWSWTQAGSWWSTMTGTIVEAAGNFDATPYKGDCNIWKTFVQKRSLQSQKMFVWLNHLHVRVAARPAVIDLCYQTFPVLALLSKIRFYLNQWKRLHSFNIFFVAVKTNPKTSMDFFFHVKKILFFFKVKTKISRSICTSSTSNNFSIIVKFWVIIKPKKLMHSFNIIIFHCRLWKSINEKYRLCKKIPSKIEVASPLYAAYTVDTVITVYTNCFTLLR